MVDIVKRYGDVSNAKILLKNFRDGISCALIGSLFVYSSKKFGKEGWQGSVDK